MQLLLLKQLATRKQALTSSFALLKSQFARSQLTLVKKAPLSLSVLKKEEVGIGYNAATGEWVNMFEAGIVDPAKVTRSALAKRSFRCSYVLDY